MEWIYISAILIVFVVISMAMAARVLDKWNHDAERERRIEQRESDGFTEGEINGE